MELLNIKKIQSLREEKQQLSNNSQALSLNLFSVVHGYLPNNELAAKNNYGLIKEMESKKKKSWFSKTIDRMSDKLDNIKSEWTKTTVELLGSIAWITLLGISAAAVISNPLWLIPLVGIPAFVQGKNIVDNFVNTKTQRQLLENSNKRVFGLKRLNIIKNLTNSIDNLNIAHTSIDQEIIDLTSNLEATSVGINQTINNFQKEIFIKDESLKQREALLDERENKLNEMAKKLDEQAKALGKKKTPRPKKPKEPTETNDVVPVVVIANNPTFILPKQEEIIPATIENSDGNMRTLGKSPEENN